jgi:hypothetical protein
MQRVDRVRSDIYNHFHNSTNCENHFFSNSNEEDYVAYYNSMYLLQDTTESILNHREKGFSTDPLSAYLEFWGVMQAIFIHQDSIGELYKAVLGVPLNIGGLQAWKSVRDLRNTCAGHPANKSRPKCIPLSRTFMGRDFGDYHEITYELWQQGIGISHPQVPLGKIIDEYACEASNVLIAILVGMRNRWPK